jgi:hypothetical protein
MPRPAAALALVTLALVQGAAAGNSASFSDPAGDVTGIPDIVSVSAASADTGRLTFRVGFAAPPVFGNGVGFSLVVDADANPATGHSDGVDYWFIFRTATGAFEPGVWNGTEFVPYPSRATSAVAGSTVTITVPAAEIGATKSIRYLVASYGGAQEDLAPDAVGTEVFAAFPLKLRPPVSVHFVPRAPRAGAVFHAVGRGISCRAKLAGRPLKRGCRWKLAAQARGKRLVVTVSNRAGRSKRFAFKVR